MKKLLTFITLIVFGTMISQNVPITPDSKQSTVDPIYNLAGLENKPEFPGGLDAFYNFFRNNFKYPSGVSQTGKTYVSFVIEKDGSLTDVKLLRGLNAEIVQEIIRVLKKSPKWKPGIQNGQLVRTMYQLPFSIELPNSPIKN